MRAWPWLNPLVLGSFFVFDACSSMAPVRGCPFCCPPMGAEVPLSENNLRTRFVRDQRSLHGEQIMSGGCNRTVDESR